MTDRVTTDRMTLAVPSNAEGGLEGVRSGHFGHCDCFTVVEIEAGEIVGVRTIANVAHEEGGCLRPVNLLASHGVDALLAAGMGARPLAGFNDMGITVYFENETPAVGDAVKLFLGGGVPVMGPQHSCGGH